MRSSAERKSKKHAAKDIVRERGRDMGEMVEEEEANAHRKKANMMRQSGANAKRQHQQSHKKFKINT